MTAPRFDIRSYTFDKHSTYLLDANVWLNVYGPMPPRHPNAIVYSDGLKRLYAAGSKIAIDALVMSEVLNRWSRLVYQHTRPKPAAFKIFRDSPSFIAVANEIAAGARRILSRAHPIGTEFAHVDLQLVLARFESGKADFNDLLIAETCRENDCILVTHDGDMKSADIPIVSGNPTLYV